MAMCFSRPQLAMICCHSAIERPYFFSMDGKYDAGPCFGHGGACSGYRAALRYFPQLGASIVVLTNIDGPDPDRVVTDLVTILTAPPPGGPVRL